MRHLSFTASDRLITHCHVLRQSPWLAHSASTSLSFLKSQKLCVCPVKWWKQVFQGRNDDVAVLITSGLCFQGSDSSARSTGSVFFESSSQNPLFVGTARAQGIFSWKVSAEQIHARNKWSEWGNFLLTGEYKILLCGTVLWELQLDSWALKFCTDVGRGVFVG